MGRPLPGDHPLALYETDEFLAQTVCDFVAPAVMSGDSALAVATAAHRRMFEQKLRASGVDVDGALAEERLLFLDAAETLASFMRPTGPDFTLFCEAVGTTLDRLMQHGRDLRVYGEMVALLWADGDLGSAIRLENFWNRRLVGSNFKLLCAYPNDEFEAASKIAAHRVCDHHTAIRNEFPAADCPPPPAREFEDRRVMVAPLDGKLRARLAESLERAGFDANQLPPGLASQRIADAAAEFEPEVVVLSVETAQKRRLLAHTLWSIRRCRPHAQFVLEGEGVSEDWRWRGFPVLRSDEPAPATVASLLERRRRTTAPSDYPSCV